VALRKAAGAAKRVAVTTPLRCVGAKDGNAAAKAKGSTAGRAEAKTIFMETIQQQQARTGVPASA
jgi:hypothetical protein